MNETDRSGLETLELTQLVELLDTGDWRTQESVGEVLIGRGKGAHAALTAGLAHPRWRVRRSSALLLDHLADEACVPPLLEALQDPVENVRRNALHSLMCQACKPAPLRGDVVGALVTCALADRSLRVRRIAALALGDQPYDDRAVAALRAILDEETDGVLLSRARRALVAQTGTMG